MTTIVQRGPVALALSTLALVSACAHADKDPSLEERAAPYRSAIAACPPGRTALTIAGAKAKLWGANERLIVKGRLQVNENAVCTLMACPSGRACCNACDFGPDAIWNLQSAQGDTVRLRGWSMVKGRMDCSETALNHALRDLDVVVEATVVQTGALPDETNADPPELLPHAESICRR